MDRFVTPDGLPVAAEAVTWTATRSGGPGGQHANTADTAVDLSVDLRRSGLPRFVVDQLVAAHGEVLRVHASDTRSQWRNREIAWLRAGELIDAAAVPVRPRRPTRPSTAARERRLSAKRTRGDIKQARRRPGRDD